MPAKSVTTLATMVAVLLAASLSGCIGGNKARPANEDVQGPAGPAEYGDTTGGIEGTVVDDEGVAIEGVTVGIPDIEVETTTDAAGDFALSNVAPGLQTVYASKLGYDSGAQVVEVRAGEVRTTQIQLIGVASPDTIYHTSEELKGFMNCGLGAVVLLVTSRCTQDPNHRVSFNFNVTPGLQTAMGEMTWQPNSGLSSPTFILDLWQNPRCSPCDPEHDYGESEGPSPLTLRTDAPFSGLKKDGETALTWFVWTPGSQDAPPFLVLVLNQPYTIWSSLFYGAPAADGFTALPS